jgi:hypothetical protein
VVNLEDLPIYKIIYSGFPREIQNARKCLKTLVDVGGLEPPTPCLQSGDFEFKCARAHRSFLSFYFSMPILAHVEIGYSILRIYALGCSDHLQFYLQSLAVNPSIETI